MIRQLAALWATHLRWVAAQAPTLHGLTQALAVERAMQQMDPRTLRAFCTELEARFARGL